MSRPDPPANIESDAEASACVTSDRAPPKPRENAEPPLLIPASGLTSTAATKATEATKPPLQSLLWLMSQPNGDYSDPGFWRDLYEGDPIADGGMPAAAPASGRSR
jgi:hypothetical protein